MGTIEVFYHGKLRDTVSLSGNLNAPPTFVENIKKKVFESSSEYARMSAKPIMIAELRRWLDDMFSVFTYFVPAKDTLGRSGGFVAVTAIIHGALPKERVKLYELFVKVHQKLIDLRILSKSQDIEADTFDRVKDELEALAKYFSEAIDQQCGATRGISNLTLNKQEENARRFNPIDINGESFVESLADAGKAYISSEFPTLASIKAAKEAEKAKGEIEKKAKENEQKQLIGDLEKQISKLSAEKESLTQQVNRLIEDNEKLKKKLGNKIDRGIDVLEDASAAVSDARKKAAKSDKAWLRIGAVLPLINLLLLCALFSFLRINLKDLKSGLDGAKKNPPQQEVIEKPKPESGVVDMNQVEEQQGTEDMSSTTSSNGPNQAQAKLDSINRSIADANKSDTEKPKFGKTYDAKILVKCNRGSIMNGNPVSIGDTLSFIDQEPKEGHEFFVAGAIFIDTQHKKAIVDGTSNEVRVWYCHKDDEKTRFAEQCNKRKYQLK